MIRKATRSTPTPPSRCTAGCRGDRSTDSQEDRRVAARRQQDSDRVLGDITLDEKGDLKNPSLRLVYLQGRQVLRGSLDQVSAAFTARTGPAQPMRGSFVALGSRRPDTAAQPKDHDDDPCPPDLRPLSPAAERPPAVADILIGAAAPFSGPNAALGEQLRRGAQMAVDDINATGGIRGESLTIKFADDGCDPRKAVDVATGFVGGRCEGGDRALLLRRLDSRLQGLSEGGHRPDQPGLDQPEIHR